MLTTQDIERAYSDERWLGFGYLGERRTWLDTQDPECPSRPERVAAVDALVIEAANRKRWSAERLFGWLNSADGRHFADRLIGWDDALPAEVTIR